MEVGQVKEAAGLVERVERERYLLQLQVVRPARYSHLVNDLPIDGKHNVTIMGRGRDPYVGLARKRPKTKWRFHWAENELITYIFAVQDICSILAT